MITEAIAHSDGFTTEAHEHSGTWRNGTAERRVGSRRSELLDHIIPLNERHLRRLLREYVSYYNDDRIHDALNKDAPHGRRVEQRPSPAASIISQP